MLGVMNTVISLCDRTGNMVRPFAEAGYPCLCIDMQHSIRRDRVDGNITYRWGNILGMTLEDLPSAAIAFAFPECTGGAVSGARDWKSKGLRGLIAWLELFEACRQLVSNLGCPWMIEQPIVDTVIEKHWRPSDYTFQPWQYGDGYTKATQLWTGGGFVMPEPLCTKKPAGTDERIWKMPPSADRANKRSETPMGFAKAVYEANAVEREQDA